MSVIRDLSPSEPMLRNGTGGHTVRVARTIGLLTFCNEALLHSGESPGTHDEPAFIDPIGLQIASTRWRRHLFDLAVYYEKSMAVARGITAISRANDHLIVVDAIYPRAEAGCGWVGNLLKLPVNQGECHHRSRPGISRAHADHDSTVINPVYLRPV